VIKLKLQIPCERFDEICAQTRIFSNTPFNMKGNRFLVDGTKQDLPQFLCIFHLLKYVVIIYILDKNIPTQNSML